MTAYAKGADVQALVANVGRLKGLRGELKGIEGAARSAMSTIEGNWGGENLLSLVRQFNGTAVPSLRSLDSAIDSMTTALQRNANAQDRASGGDGNLFSTGGPSGGSGGGSGGGGGGSWGPGNGGGGGAGDGKKPYWEGGHGAKKDYTMPVTDENGNTTTRSKGPFSTTETEDKTTTTRNSKWDAWDSETTTETNKTTKIGDKEVGHEWSKKTEKEFGSEANPQSPEDKAKAEDKAAHPNREAVKDAALSSVNATHKDEKTYGHDWSKDPNAVMAGSATTHTEFGIKDGALYAGAGASASYALAKGSIGDEKLGASGSVGAEAKADAGASLGKDGLKAEASAHAEVGAKGEAHASYSNGPVEAGASVNAMAGAEANANASVGIGKDGLKASAGVDAFAGVKAGVDGNASIAGIGVTGGAEVYAGVGAHANVDASFSADSVKVSVDVGAAIGIGGGVKFGFDVNPTKTIEDVGGAIKDAGSAIKDALPDIF